MNFNLGSYWKKQKIYETRENMDEPDSDQWGECSKTHLMLCLRFYITFHKTQK